MGSGDLPASGHGLVMSLARSIAKARARKTASPRQKPARPYGLCRADRRTAKGAASGFAIGFAQEKAYSTRLRPARSPSGAQPALLNGQRPLILRARHGYQEGRPASTASWKAISVFHPRGAGSVNPPPRHF